MHISVEITDGKGHYMYFYYTHFYESEVEVRKPCLTLPRSIGSALELKFSSTQYLESLLSNAVRKRRDAE